MNNKWLVGSAILFALLLFSCFFIRIPVLEIQTDAHSYFIKDKPITLSWIHSVEKEPWHEIYERQHDQIVLTETYFKSFGAGVPSDLEVMDERDGFVHMKVNRIMDEVHVVVSENVQTSITVDGNEIALYQMLEPYSEVTIKVKNLKLWNIFGGEFL